MKKTHTWLVLGGVAVAGVLLYRQSAAASPASGVAGLGGLFDAFRAGNRGVLIAAITGETGARAAARKWFGSYPNPIVAPRSSLAALYRSYPERMWRPWITDELLRMGMPSALLERAMLDAKQPVPLLVGGLRRPAAPGRGTVLQRKVP